MKITPDTAATIIVSLASATLAGAASLVWWVAGLQNRVKNTEKDVAALDKRVDRTAEIQEIERDKLIKLDKLILVFSTKLDMILEKLNKINEK